MAVARTCSFDRFQTISPTRSGTARPLDGEALLEARHLGVTGVVEGLNGPGVGVLGGRRPSLTGRGLGRGAASRSDDRPGSEKKLYGNTTGRLHFGSSRV